MKCTLHFKKNLYEKKTNTDRENEREKESAVKVILNFNIIYFHENTFHFKI